MTRGSHAPAFQKKVGYEDLFTLCTLVYKQYTGLMYGLWHIDVSQKLLLFYCGNIFWRFSQRDRLCWLILHESNWLNAIYIFIQNFTSGECCLKYYS